MRAAVVKSPDHLAVTELPDPVPAAGEVLVEVDAAGAGYVDVMAVRGGYRTPLHPGDIPGMEVAGRVTAVGPDVPDALVGQRVLALMLEAGGYAERAVTGADAVLPLPDGLDADAAVAAGINAMVAEIALRRAGLRAGERVLVLGAGGGIGVLATQLAHARGAEVTAVTSSAERAARLRALGATRTVDRHSVTVTEGTGAGTGEADAYGTYDLVLDTVAGPDTAKHLSLLRTEGRYVLCGAAAGAPGADTLTALLTDFHKSPTLYVLSLNSVSTQERRQSWRRVTELITEGGLTPVVDERLPLDEADAALRRVAEGRQFGKVVLLPR
ncbi:zinc-binding alcohol dehydrogenase family protein [Streptomyces phytohabitans]|uniref:quinone oxidoreductase family protein n=1 Tax=Streptomyces phytohabitans TaxID=1150371 RepID=UPI00345BE719